MWKKVYSRGKGLETVFWVTVNTAFFFSHYSVLFSHGIAYLFIAQFSKTPFKYNCFFVTDEGGNDTRRPPQKMVLWSLSEPRRAGSHVEWSPYVDKARQGVASLIDEKTVSLRRFGGHWFSSWSGLCWVCEFWSLKWCGWSVTAR